MKHAVRNCVTEWTFHSARPCPDPFNDVELDVVFHAPDGTSQRVPAFWAGENTWRVRFAPTQTGIYRYRSECSDTANPELHGKTGELSVAEYEGANPLLRHGPLRAATDRRHFEHADGTPFFWLADTWWMGLCRRLAWPGEFQRLAADRVTKGFTVVQIVAGLYPDMPAFDERGANEAGFPWEPDYARIRPAYFDMADLRIDWLVSRGLVPCVVGCWGYHLPWLGIERMKKHWRNLVARYGAYPVVWCLAGEGSMPYYLSTDKPKDIAFQKDGWTELGHHVRDIDPYHHPVTIHPTDAARNNVNDTAVLDLDMLQTGHGDRASLGNTLRLVTEAYGREPRLPVINSEVCYEGIGEACRQEVQRLMFWASVLSGACGHTYGANGIWQVNRREQPYGPSPHGMSWGNTPWDEASQLPGSAQLGLAKALLARFEWWRMEPHPEWIEPHWTPQNPLQPFAAGIPGELRIAYLPLMWNLPTVKALEPGIAYRAFLWNPVNGDEYPAGECRADANGDWRPALPRFPIYQDWVLVLERER
ncbi:MAG: hypothetical protein A3K19_12705 [Lentisphaerae bacterium RIFOXYB12_FULL_65_16]|nr:MAG: hypothetical protein A3K18_24345 [Lentisphaerae bacterium RIFOXYA12_64_32]OGV88084.1 MAG: hypothetical protein A3K19_12705 [Lentisphaerae bacterium RIFOXYB12_FULL_65_16]